MVKPLLLVALVANIFLFAASTGRQKPKMPCKPSQRACRLNEVWSNCPIAVCRPKTCTDVGFPITCLDLKPDGQCPVKPGCICKQGYVRNFGNICIPMKHCLSCGGDQNAVSGCGNHYNNLCSNYSSNPGKCETDCLYNGCDCRPGFVFDEIIGKCVFPNQCSRMYCKKNEVYDPCPAPCPYRTCGIDDAAVSCAPALYPGNHNCAPPKCRCKDGYYKNDIGKCVLWKNCPVCQGLNEVYDPCPPPCPPQRCDVNIALILCAVPPQLGDPECEPGCRCIDNYVRNQSGICIPRDECPICPNANEVYDPCIAPCPARRCDVDDRLIKCAAPPKVGDPSCVAGCRCADGYYRNSLGCVAREECPACDGPHEFYACGGACDNVCATLPKQNQTNCPIVNVKCNDMCYCEEGYARDDNNTCIPIEDCVPPKCTGDHEVYSNCIQGQCNPKNCSQLGFPVACPRIDPQYCIEGCLCEEGYVKDENNVCIPKTECPSCGGDSNAVAGCGNCNKRCSDIGKEPVFCTQICNENGCDCKEGFYYDDNTKKCVLPEQCTPTCGPDEVYDECVQGHCNPKNCSQLGFPVACPKIDSRYCIKGCLCKQGYLRNDKGVCIPIQQCPSCGGDPNAESGCGNYCGNQCSDYTKKNITCPLACQLNGCKCRQGYVYDSNTKKCVLPKDCTLVCKIDEVYSDCINSPCPVQNCSLIGITVLCVDVDQKDCIKGCLCKPPLMKKDDGLCVSIADCKPATCNKPNEYFEPCDYGCPPQTCESLDMSYACPIRDSDTCKARCKCKSGYFRNKLGNCITEAQCRKCMGPYEYFSCGGACDNVCATLDKQNQTNCPIINIKCNEMCYCEKDYARAKNGTCIPIKQCKEPQCGMYERYEQCPARLCGPQNCSELGYPKPCPYLPANSKCPVKPACVCVEGYVRNSTGKCIPKNECPSCGGDPNAQSGCGINCNKNCEDIGKEPRACILLCKNNACDCKEGYYYDKKQKKCVLPSKCTDICSGNFEIYENCTNPTCRPNKCSEVGFPLNCTDPPACTKGCICDDGYVRNGTSGICIPIKQCPSCGGDKNAVSGCGVNCLKKCYDLQNPSRPRPCPRICNVNSCDCKEGFYYDENTKTCVEAADCTATCNKPNEYFEPCDYGCPPQTCESLDMSYACPIREGDTCKARCKCKPGYFRNKHGDCITEAQCRKCMGPYEYFSCGGACDNVCATLDKQNQTNCPIINIKCNEMCYCEKDYARAKNGTCIPIKQCKEPQCGMYERYEQCPARLCGPQNCSELGYPKPCPYLPANSKCPVKPACVCIDGYVRNLTGKCIPKNECPSCGGDPNAQSGCGINCDKNCEDIGKEPRACILLCKNNACDCKEGYYYDKKQKKCVLPSKCTDICSGLFEIFENCTNPTCRPKKCSEVGFPLNCTDPPACTKGCICDVGYVRNETSGICIPIKQCPSCGGDLNAQSGCGINCGKYCEDIGTEPGACITLCKENACDCKVGYYLNTQLNKCVLPSECPKVCNGAHESYENCTNPSYDPKKCSEVGYPVNYTHPPACTTGCICDQGFVRNDSTGSCIPIKQCPSCGGDPNAHSGCGINCGKKCEDIGKKPGACILLCKLNGCDCNDGYYYDQQQKKCVLPSQCTKICTGKNEIYENCTNPTCRPKKCSEVGFLLNCTDPPACTKGCICDEGYVRNGTSGICIPIKQCPSCGGDKNAVSGCGVNCLKKCYDLQNPSRPRPCPRICNVNSCDCKEGFYYDENTKTCVDAADCTPICGADEVYDACINGGCGYRNCSQIDKQVICIDPRECQAGCTCKEGYLRMDDTGICVPKDKCPKICNKPNEEYVKCPPICPPQTCKSLNQTYHCPLIKVKINESDCVGECRCKEGYYRNLIDECISKKDCLKCKGAHEYFSCGPACDSECDLDTQSKDNCSIKNKKCVPRCYCENGYARNQDGVCVCIEECPGHSADETCLT